jgi:hypothetical protein
MGGEDTEVGGEANILLEAANFEPIGILRSPSGMRSHRGLETAGRRASTAPRPQAAALATELILEADGRVSGRATST